MLEQAQPIFEEIRLRGTTFRNRIWVPAMCQYMSDDGLPSPWHLAHYAGLATGVGCVIVEATAVGRETRVTPQDLVFDSRRDVRSYSELAVLIRSRGAIPGIQLSHAGRKGSRSRPWEGDVPIEKSAGGWDIGGPSAIPFAEGYSAPRAMPIEELKSTIEAFRHSAAMANEAGFDVIEVHAGHGRLLHSFLSPISNRRTDAYGGDLASRALLLRQVARAIRQALPDRSVLSFRLSCVDWCDGGLTIDDSATVAAWLKEDGVDIINCSSGGIVKPLRKQTSPGYQVSFARTLRVQSQIATGAVGLITSFEHANEILSTESADVVFMGRHLLMDPFSLLRYAAKVGRTSLLPPPYARAMSRGIAADVQNFVPEL